MGRQLNKLTTRQVASFKEPGRYSDGGGLYLSISANGGRRWVFIYTRDGKTREMGLGSAGDGQVGLAEARGKADAARKALADGKDPLEQKGEAKRAQAAVRTFGELADSYVEAHRPGWKNAKHAKQWEYSLRELAAPLRKKRADHITTDDVLGVLKPLWQSVPETARRLRGRIEKVLSTASAHGIALSENVARWHNHLDGRLAKRSKHRQKHHKALPYDKVPAFMADLRQRPALAARALEFTILTCVRTSEALQAPWSEFDLQKKVWIIPGLRMKMADDHRVPLCDRAIEILNELKRDKRGDLLFPSQKTHLKPISEMSMLMLLRRMDIDATVHGFRSSFRDWVSEETGFSHHTAEHALAHKIENKTEAAYRRGTEFEKRRQLMNAWAAYCEPKEGKVISMKAGQGK